jgi:hypothetical protein
MSTYLIGQRHSVVGRVPLSVLEIQVRRGCDVVCRIIVVFGRRVPGGPGEPLAAAGAVVAPGVRLAPRAPACTRCVSRRNRSSVSKGGWLNRNWGGSRWLFEFPIDLILYLGMAMLAVGLVAVYNWTAER